MTRRMPIYYFGWPWRSVYWTPSEVMMNSHLGSFKSAKSIQAIKLKMDDYSLFLSITVSSTTFFTSMLWLHCPLFNIYTSGLEFITSLINNIQWNVLYTSPVPSHRTMTPNSLSHWTMTYPHTSYWTMTVQTWK